MNKNIIFLVFMGIGSLLISCQQSLNSKNKKKVFRYEMLKFPPNSNDTMFVSVEFELDSSWIDMPIRDLRAWGPDGIQAFINPDSQILYFSYGRGTFGDSSALKFDRERFYFYINNTDRLVDTTSTVTGLSSIETDTTCLVSYFISKQKESSFRWFLFDLHTALNFELKFLPRKKDASSQRVFSEMCKSFRYSSKIGSK